MCTLMLIILGALASLISWRINVLASLEYNDSDALLQLSMQGAFEPGLAVGIIKNIALAHVSQASGEGTSFQWLHTCEDTWFGNELSPVNFPAGKGVALQANASMETLASAIQGIPPRVLRLIVMYTMPEGLDIAAFAVKLISEMCTLQEVTFRSSAPGYPMYQALQMVTTSGRDGQDSCCVVPAQTKGMP
ncbi:hypothetical protein L226DRAFT_524299 [Lentinus tigrinus ALCF2SS1-7]|uniref:Uncharacterized protein n=1 Tax=Lentinus tigrinus ALCF2SS1-6 TaxID=1328759 RepID=A0A5C2S1B1_9APHY|nr:hypothetical protein L227DRAFT_565491 [Lentinus tigrinus ALCF2SS1-6]RPD73166.1 hypothetical protein L226DRAFT_524299 [Lentinus tigrinus ALCF2SS1-7]